MRVLTVQSHGEKRTFDSCAAQFEVCDSQQKQRDEEMASYYTGERIMSGPVGWERRSMRISPRDTYETSCGFIYEPASLREVETQTIALAKWVKPTAVAIAALSIVYLSFVGTLIHWALQ